MYKNLKLNEFINLNDMNTTDLMIFPEINQEDFDFEKLLNNKDYKTISGLDVKIDRIIRDITQTTVIAISGTMVIRGVKVRAVWDMFGNIVSCKEALILFSPKKFTVNLDNLFAGTTKDLFKLVHIQEIR